MAACGGQEPLAWLAFTGHLMVEAKAKGPEESTEAVVQIHSAPVIVRYACRQEAPDRCEAPFQ